MKGDRVEIVVEAGMASATTTWPPQGPADGLRSPPDEA
jgi:hypothetical protein